MYQNGNMKTLGIMLLCASVGGCSSLILREDDTTGQTVAKVATRAFLAPLTLFFSESHISNLKRTAKRTEQLAEQRAEQAVRFGKMCEMEGYESGTPEYMSCLSSKQDQAERICSGRNEEEYCGGTRAYIYGYKRPRSCPP